MRELWVDWPRSLILLIWTKTKSRSIERREKGSDRYPAILPERAWSIKNLLQGRRNIAVSIIKNCYFVRCKRKPTVSIVLYFLARNQCGQSRARKMSAYCPLGLLRNQYTGFPFILPTVTASDPTNRCMLFLSHGALELV